MNLLITTNQLLVRRSYAQFQPYAYFSTVEQLFEKTLVLEGDVYSVEMMDTSGSHIDNLAYQKAFN
jgi:hypothetical protein